MKLLNLSLLFAVLMVGAQFTVKAVHAQEDEVVEDKAEEPTVEAVEEEEEEGVVEDEDDGMTTDAVTSEDLEEEAEAEQITSHKDITTAILFQSGAEPSVFAGKKTKGYIHFANGGSNNFIITAIDGSFRYPQDYSYIIQNFTSLTPNKMIGAGKEGSFSYTFTPGELAGGRSFGFSVLVNYKDVEGNLYQDAVYNQTVLVQENEDDVDTETFFMYLMLSCMGALTLLAIYHVAGSKGKKSKRPQASSASAGTAGFEMGTANGPVDMQWIPKETLQVIQKTPSPRSARRRAGKKSAAASSGEENVASESD